MSKEEKSYDESELSTTRSEYEDTTDSTNEDIVGFFSDAERLQRMRQQADEQYIRRKQEEKQYNPPQPPSSHHLEEAVQAASESARKKELHDNMPADYDDLSTSTDEFEMVNSSDEQLYSESKMWSEQAPDVLNLDQDDDDDFELLEQETGDNKTEENDVPLSRTERQRKLRKKKHHRLIVTIIIIALVIVIGGAGLFVMNDLNSTGQLSWIDSLFIKDYSGPGYGSVQFTVMNGDTATEVGERLVKKNIIASKNIFVNMIIQDHDQSALQPGTFMLKYHMSSQEVINIITNPSNAKDLLEMTSNMRASDIVSQLTVDNPAWTKSEIEAALNDKGKGILPACAHGNYEGWLQPGTYDPRNYKTPSDLLAAMVKARIAKLDAMKVPTGDDREKILTIASIIGSEVNQQQYYGQVSRVIQNRLAANMVLGMDSVIAYGNNTQALNLTKTMLTDASNPYNDRLHVGLPPSPICQPNAAMIEAAMNPTPGNWIYFVTVNLNTGETKFTNSEQQFQQYKAQYDAWLKAHPNF